MWVEATAPPPEPRARARALSLTPAPRPWIPRARAAPAALSAPDAKAEEAVWTRIVESYSGDDFKGAAWRDDLLSRALGNRGNVRSRMGKLNDALRDYDKSIAIAPWAPDPVLNRGVVYEAQGKYALAIQDYESVLEVSPEDPAAWNNLGNAKSGLGRYEEAAEDYRRAAFLAPQFAFAGVNEALALWQLDERRDAIRRARSLLRRYPEFPDARAALAAMLWAEGLEVEAEDEWNRVSDTRYRDMEWIRDTRKWPPAAATAMESFLSIGSSEP